MPVFPVHGEHLSGEPEGNHTLPGNPVVQEQSRDRPQDPVPEYRLAKGPKTCRERVSLAGNGNESCIREYPVQGCAGKELDVLALDVPPFSSQ